LIRRGLIAHACRRGAGHLLEDLREVRLAGEAQFQRDVDNRFGGGVEQPWGLLHAPLLHPTVGRATEAGFEDFGKVIGAAVERLAFCQRRHRQRRPQQPARADQTKPGRDELLKALTTWVESGTAPGSIEVASLDGSVKMPL
jgi:hypothetical protein